MFETPGVASLVLVSNVSDFNLQCCIRFPFGSKLSDMFIELASSVWDFCLKYKPDRYSAWSLEPFRTGSPELISRRQCMPLLCYAAFCCHQLKCGPSLLEGGGVGSQYRVQTLCLDAMRHKWFLSC